MPTPEPCDSFDPALLRLGRDLRRQGIEPARHRTDGEPTYHPVCRGVWIRSADWRELSPTRRHAALVHGIALRGEADGLVFTREAAAALWDLPRIDTWPSLVHGTCTGPRVRSSGQVVRHIDEFDLAYRHQGLLVTSPARTIVDLARTGPVTNAVVAADRAVRLGLCDESELWSEARDVPPRSRGRHRALLVADLVDGRSMSPGESLSRVQMFLLNLPGPDLQVRCEDERGLIGYADFGWDGVVGEFDGQVKYRVPEGPVRRRRLRSCGPRSDARTASGQPGSAWLAGCTSTPCTPSGWLAGSPNRGSCRGRVTPGSTSARVLVDAGPSPTVAQVASSGAVTAAPLDNTCATVGLVRCRGSSARP
jgi:hypothetical protein